MAVVNRVESGSGGASSSTSPDQESPASASSLRLRAGPRPALVRRAFRDARVRTVGFAALFALYAYVQPVAYRHTYPTVSDRLSFARTFAGNKAIRLFYGEPHSLVTVGGYAAWRVGGTLAILAAAFGLLAAVRALRAEEDAGRTELVLAEGIGRGQAYLTAMAAVAAGILILWLAELLGFVAAGLPAGGAAYLALATMSVTPVCVAVGAVASQLAPTRRVALELGGAVVALFFVLRVVADTASGAGWLRWATPLGWAEELRPFAGSHPLVLVLPAAATGLLLMGAARMTAGRDIGTGMVPVRDSAAARLRLLSSTTAQALRSGRASLLVWISSVGAFAFVLGVIAKSVSAAGIPQHLRRELAKLGSGSILTPSGYLSFTFIFFILAVSLFACGQIGVARHEEAEDRLETLLGLPVSRTRWLGGRLLLAAGAAAAISLAAGFLAWAGLESAAVSFSVAKMLETGANCLPVALLFLGLSGLFYALAPRASAGLSYGLVAVGFLWQLVGSLLGAPKWLVDLTPFAHVGLLPTQPFRAGAAAIMVGIGLVAALTALAAFRRRDLLGA